MGCKLFKTRRSRVAPLTSSHVAVKEAVVTSSRNDRGVTRSLPLQDDFLQADSTRIVPSVTVRTGSRSSAESSTLVNSSRSGEAGRRTPPGKSRVGDKADRKTVIDLLASWRDNGFLDDIKNTVFTMVEETTLEKLCKRLGAKNIAYMVRLKNSPSFHKELAKAYAVFCWITNHVQYDYNCLDVLESGALSEDDTSPTTVVRSRRTICSGYSRLFVALSDRMGLSAKYISGHFKSLKENQLLSSDYKQFSPDKSNSHAWNMIQIKGVWFPVDCTFGAGYADSENPRQFKRKFNPLYFATPPEQLVYTHKPKDDLWQLLDYPQSLENFKHRIAPNVDYFRLGIEAEEEMEHITIPAESPQSVVRLKFKAESDIHLKVKLFRAGEATNINCNARLTYTQRSDNGYVTISIALPGVGLYCADVFACRRSEQVDSDEWTYTGLFLNYFIDNFKPLPEGVSVGYPVVNPLSASLVHFKLLQWKACDWHIAENITGQTEIEFQMLKDIPIKHSIVDSSGKALHHFTSLQQAGVFDTTMVRYILKVVFPETGDWTIVVSVKESRDILVKYHVLATKAQPAQSYPYISSDLVQLPNHKVPSLQKGLLKLPFRTTKTLFFQGYVCPYPRISNDSISYNQAHVSKEGIKKYQLNAVIPSTGKWEIGVLLAETDSKGTTTLTETFSVLTEAVSESECSPLLAFPQLSSAASNLRIKIPKTPICSNLFTQEPVSLKFFSPSNIIFSHSIEETSDQNDAPIRKYTVLSLSNKPSEPNLLRAVFPRPGRWIVRLFAGVDFKQNLKEVLLFCITLTDTPTNHFCGFPEVLPLAAHLTQFHLLEWSRTKNDYIAECTNGVVEISFTINQDIELTHYVVKGKSDQNADNERLYNISSLRPLGSTGANSQKFTLRAAFSENGIWTICLLEKQAECLSSLMQYTVLVKTV